MIKKITTSILSLLLFLAVIPMINVSLAQVEAFGKTYTLQCWSTETDCRNVRDRLGDCDRNSAGQWCVEAVPGSTPDTSPITGKRDVLLNEPTNNCATGFNPSITDEGKTCNCKVENQNPGTCTNENGVGIGCNPGYIPTTNGSGACSCVLSNNPGNCGSSTRRVVDPNANCGNGFITTAIGCVPIRSTQDFVNWFLRWAIGISGGIAFLLIVMASFQIMTASGDPQKLQGGRELLTAAISGLILIIFSVFLLRLIGVTILQIPGL